MIKKIINWFSVIRSESKVRRIETGTMARCDCGRKFKQRDIFHSYCSRDCKDDAATQRKEKYPVFNRSSLEPHPKRYRSKGKRK